MLLVVERAHYTIIESSFNYKCVTKLVNDSQAKVNSLLLEILNGSLKSTLNAFPTKWRISRYFETHFLVFICSCQT